MSTIEREDKITRAEAQGQAQFDCIKEMVEALEGYEAAAKAEGWTGPHTDKFGAIYFECNDADTNDSGQNTTWACPTWQALCDEFAIEPDQDNEDARRTINESPLSVQIRSGWYSPGAQGEDTKPAEYEILLCTGGPAVSIVGQLSKHGEPETATMEVQDWFTPWTPIRPQVSAGNYDSEPIMLAYARCFYFGE